MFRNILKVTCYNKQNILYCRRIDATRNTTNRFVQNIKCVVALPSSFQSQRRTYSSGADSTQNVLHKVLFVNASPLERETSPTENLIFVEENKSNDTDIRINSAENTSDNIVSDNIASHNVVSDNVVNDNVVSDHVASSFDGIEYIPPPPEPPEIMEIAPPELILNALGEPTFESLGLASYWPAGWVQSALEFIHVSGGLPWWATIAAATVVIRICVFPLVIKSQRNMAVMSKHSPTMQALNQKVTDARNRGNHMEAAQASYEMQKFMTDKNINPIKAAILPLAQAPVFISMFVGLRGCANLPVESFKTGGMAWFTDLTVADPYFALPILTCITLLVTIELGADSGVSATSQKSMMIRYVFRALPFIMFPFIMNFPTAVLCYWLSTNVFSLSQVGFLRIPEARKYFDIEQQVKHSKESTPMSAKGFMDNFKETISNAKIQAELRDRAEHDRVRFQRAGVGPVMKTFKHDPTIGVPPNVINVKGIEKDR